jgi:SAM-dependent methyltransferase
MSPDQLAIATTDDTAAAAAFAERIARMLDDGAAAVLLGLGHRAGLFAVMAGLPPATSGAIAARAGLAERYVREWLAAMTTARIVEYDAADGTYRLPPERAACLVPDAPLGNLAVFGQHVGLMGQVAEPVLRCLRAGGGLAYDDYPCFHSIMEEDSAQTVTAALFDHILPLVPDLETRLTAGIDVLDAGCGRGSALRALAARYPASRFTGYDLCPDAVAHGRDAAAAAGLVNLHFAARDLSTFDERARFDLVTSFDAIHDQKDPETLIRALHAALRPGGVHLVQDIGGSARLEKNLDFPFATFLYAISLVHCTPVSIGQGGVGLGTMWGWETAEAMLRAAGFAVVERHVLEHDPMNVWFVAQK